MDKWTDKWTENPLCSTGPLRATAQKAREEEVEMKWRNYRENEKGEEDEGEEIW